MNIKHVARDELNEIMAKYTGTMMVTNEYDWLLSQEALVFSWLLNCSEASEECERVLKVQGWVNLKK